MERIGLIIPTYNAGRQFTELLQQIDQQDCQLDKKLIIDSSSHDATRTIGDQHGFEIIQIPHSEFNHGGTRQQAFLHLCEDTDFIIFLTQDVLLTESCSLSKLVRSFAGADIGAVYGRQLPQAGASLDAQIQRFFNYPACSRLKSLTDKEQLGIKTPFLSNSFAAYRCAALQSVGGFPPHVAACEDMYVGAKLLLQHWKIAYNADAMVYHSHDYSLRQNFQRYYLTGIFHQKERWIQRMFGHSEGEGMKLLYYQLRYAYRKQGASALLRLLFNDGVKYAAYNLGKWHAK